MPTAHQAEPVAVGLFLDHGALHRGVNVAENGDVVLELMEGEVIVENIQPGCLEREIAL